MQACINSLLIENAALTHQIHVAAVRKENWFVLEDHKVHHPIYHKFLPLFCLRDYCESHVLCGAQQRKGSEIDHMKHITWFNNCFDLKTNIIECLERSDNSYITSLSPLYLKKEKKKKRKVFLTVYCLEKVFHKMYLEFVLGSTLP